MTNGKIEDGRIEDRRLVLLQTQLTGLTTAVELLQGQINDLLGIVKIQDKRIDVLNRRIAERERKELGS